MKKSLIIFLGAIAMNAHAAQLSNFSQVAEAVKNGKHLSFVWDLKNCQTQVNLPEVITSLEPNAVMLVGEMRITASDMHFTLNDPTNAGNPTYGYSKIDLINTDDANLKVTVMKASDYSKLRELTVTCHLGQGLNIFTNN